MQAYRVRLDSQGLAPASINVRLSAIRKLAGEASDNGLLDPGIAAGIARVRGVRQLGQRVGTWLTLETADRLLNVPDLSTVRGKRDVVMLALLLGCGLRRQEAARLECEQIQQRDYRWAIIDLRGKHGRIRSVPMPTWGKLAIDAWSKATGLTVGRILRAVNKADKIVGTGFSGEAILQNVRRLASEIGIVITPHDLRRTFAQLAHRGEAAIDQIQLSLGHASLVTTERYLGVKQDFKDAPCDRLGLKLDQRLTAD